MCSQGGEDVGLDGGWQTGWSHIHTQMNQKEQLGSETDCATQGYNAWK